MRKLQTTITITLTLLVLAPSAMAQQPEKYLPLATNRTGTMQDELNEAGARGYRFAGTQGGETAFGGRETVVIDGRSIQKAAVSATSCSQRTGPERCRAR